MAWRKLTPEEQREVTLTELERVRELVRRGATLTEVLVRGTVEAWWARQAVQRHISDLSLPQWDAYRWRTRGERLRALDLAIRDFGGKGPRRGGWRVSSGR